MKLIYHPLVKEDIKKIDKSLYIFIKKALGKIKANPKIGKLLGNINNKDLSKCRKVYFFKKKYRIVYEITDDEEIFIWSIGKREDQIVYLNAFKRKMSNPTK